MEWRDPRGGQLIQVSWNYYGQEEVIGRLNEGLKLSSAMNRLWKVRANGVKLKRMMYERIGVPSVLYGFET